LSAAYLSAAMSSRKRELSATASSASSNATGARSASSYCLDEQGSTQPENDLGAPLEAVEQRVSSIAGESARGRGGESSMAKVEEHIAAAQPAVPLQVVSAASPPEAVEQRNSSIVDHRSIFCEKCQKLVVDGPGHQKRCQHAARKCTVDELVILAARRAAKRARSEVSSVDRAQNKGAAKRARSEVSPVDRAQDALGEDVRRGSTSSAPKVGRCTILESQAQRRGRGRQGRGIVAEVEHAAAAQPDTQCEYGEMHESRDCTNNELVALAASQATKMACSEASSVDRAQEDALGEDVGHGSISAAPKDVRCRMWGSQARRQKRQNRVLYCVTCQEVFADGPGHKARSGTRNCSNRHTMRPPTDEERDKYEASCAMGQPRQRHASESKGMQWVFDFGKHKGELLGDIQHARPLYIQWMVKNNVHVTPVRRHFRQALLDAGLLSPDMPLESLWAPPAARPKRTGRKVVGREDHCSNCGGKGHHQTTCNQLAAHEIRHLAYDLAAPEVMAYYKAKYTPQHQRGVAASRRSRVPVQRSYTDLARMTPLNLVKVCLELHMLDDLSGHACFRQRPSET
jgi:hypothetical protein